MSRRWRGFRLCSPKGTALWCRRWRSSGSDMARGFYPDRSESGQTPSGLVRGERLVDLVEADAALPAPDLLAALVIEDGERDRACHVEGLEQRILASLVEEVGIEDARLGEDPRDLAAQRAGVVLHEEVAGDPDDAQTAGGEACLGRRHVRQLLDAGVAPRRPEVHEERRALAVGDLSEDLVEARRRERRRSGRRGLRELRVERLGGDAGSVGRGRRPARSSGLQKSEQDQGARQGTDRDPAGRAWHQAAFFHFTEQPKAFVAGRGTGLPASMASSASFRSRFWTSGSFTLSSTRPRYFTLPSASRRKTCGVTCAP